MTDLVNHPPHYTAHPSRVEAVELCEWLSFNTGNVLKYVWRSGHKGQLREDLQKALWYVNREHTRILGGGSAPGVPVDFIDCAQRVVRSEPKNLLSVILMQVALPRWITCEHLDTARWHLAAEIAKIYVHRLVIRTGRLDGQPWQAACGLQEKNLESTANDTEVTCPDCLRMTT